jgi:hypothetical protein
MRICFYILGLTAAASTALANPPATHPVSHATTAVQPHGKPHTSTPKPAATTTSTSGATTTASGSSTSTTPTVKTTTTPTLNPIAAKITSHPQLDSKLTAMLPKGMTLNQASMGFKNQGQFIAALHVSRNLGVSFKDLRTQMVTKHKSLGQSIQTLKKTADTDDAVKTAEHQANDDVKTTSMSSKKRVTTRKNGDQ